MNNNAKAIIMKHHGSDGMEPLLLTLTVEEMTVMMEEYAASRVSRTLSAVPSEEDACKAYNKRNELIFITESNFSTTLQSWIACYRWMKEELIKRGIAG